MHTQFRNQPEMQAEFSHRISGLFFLTMFSEIPCSLSVSVVVPKSVPQGHTLSVGVLATRMALTAAGHQAKSRKIEKHIQIFPLLPSTLLQSLPPFVFLQCLQVHVFYILSRGVFSGESVQQELTWPYQKWNQTHTFKRTFKMQFAPSHNQFRLASLKYIYKQVKT